MPGLVWMVLVGAMTLAPGPRWHLVESYTATCPSLTAYYLDDWATDGGDRADMRLMGRLLLGGGRGPALAGLVMEDGRASMVIVRATDAEVEMTPLEFHGRYPSPCALLGGRGPEP